jgi:hypothetical protein
VRLRHRTRILLPRNSSLHALPNVLFRPGLRFADVHEHGGFGDAAQVLLPRPRSGERLEYPIGYRHMVSLRTASLIVDVPLFRRCPLPPAPLFIPNAPIPFGQCHFMSMLWFGALREYEYAMRVDEDVCLTRLPSSSVFAALSADCE